MGSGRIRWLVDYVVDYRSDSGSSQGGTLFRDIVL